MAADPLIGTVIAGHRVERLIGQGGQSVVYLAEHVRLGRKRALKLLPARFAEDPEARKRFEEEWKLAASIEHPSIVEVFDAGELEGQLYIAMRYVAGPDLGALVQTEGALEPARALGILEQIASALDAAHTLGLVHRDVKPANILVGEGDRAFLSDFGVAKFGARKGGLTRAGYFIGTVDYAAPEQIEGKEVDGRADVYALGCVLYQCLTGSVVFVKDTEPQVMLAHVLETPLPPSARRSGLSPALDAVAAKALAKSRDDRYGGCVEFVAAAREALAAHPDPPVAIPEPAAPPAPAPEPEQAPPDPPPTGATRLAATPVIPAAEPPAPPAPPAAAPPPPPAPGPAAPAARARRPFRIPLTRKTGLIAVALVVVAIVGVVLATSGGGGGGPQLEVCELYAAGVCGTPGFERPGSTSRMVLVLHVSSSRPGETVEFDLTRGADTFTFFGNRLDPKTYVAPIFNQDSSGNAVPFGQESFGVRVKVAGKPVKVSPSTIVFH